MIELTRSWLEAAILGLENRGDISDPRFTRIFSVKRKILRDVFGCREMINNLDGLKWLFDVRIEVEQDDSEWRVVLESKLENGIFGRIFQIKQEAELFAHYFKTVILKKVEVVCEKNRYYYQLKIYCCDEWMQRTSDWISYGPMAADWQDPLPLQEVFDYHRIINHDSSRIG